MKSTSDNLEQAAVQQQCRSLRLPAVMMKPTLRQAVPTHAGSFLI